MAINNPIPSRVLTGVASLIESYGQDPDSIAEGVGIEAAALYQPDIMISAIAINDLLEQAALACNDRFFCLRLAPLQSWGILGPIWTLMSRADNVGEMLQILSDNLEMHSDTMSNYLNWDESGGAVFSIEIRSLAVSCKPIHSTRTQAIELALGVSCFELRRIFGNSWRPGYAQLRCAAPEDQAPMRQVFGNKIYFNQDIDAIYLSKRDLAVPLGTAVYDSAQPMAPEQLQASDSCSLPFALQVDRIIRMRINSEGCSAKDVATALGVNQRTMQYRLQQHHTSYQKIYDATRLDLARHYLKKSDLSIAAVAERLRFTDSAAFSRFFKDKVGHSPRSYAKKARGGGTNIADS